jgi:hypothetical protein
MRRWVLFAVAAVALLVTACGADGTAPGTWRPPGLSEGAVLWRDPGPVERLDLAAGPGGPERAPRPPFKFIAEDLSASSPKVEVDDAAGVRWRIKWGQEVHSETFASRLAWAAGYFVEPTYFVKGGRIDGAQDLRRAAEYVAADGTFADASFERRDSDHTRLGGEQSWAWNDNPFVGTRELNGLKVVMMLVSNWDSKDIRDAGRDSNTGIFVVPSGGRVEYHYAVTDWGGTMGTWGGVLTRTKWDCEGFTSQTPRFVTGAPGGLVEFGYSGEHTDDIRGGVRAEDARWIMQYLGRLSDDQLRAGLEASGAAPEDAECFLSALRARLGQLRSVS